MNRRQRRREEALMRAREKKAPPLKPAREDGRPLFYDITGESRMECFYCLRAGITAFHAPGEAFMADPANSPDGSGDIHIVCRGHLPDNAVIYNPGTNTCRDKGGSNVWREDDPIKAEQITENFQMKS